MDPRQLSSPGYWIWLWDAYGKEIAFSLLTGVIKVAAVIAAYFIARFLIFKLLNRVLVGSLTKVSGDVMRARQATVWALQSLLRSAIGLVLAFVAVLMILQASGVRVETLLATAGVAGIAVGIGAQKLVRDMIGGSFVLAEDQYGVGDYVTIENVSGSVEDVGLRSTRVRDASGGLHTFANGDVVQVCNHSRGKMWLSMDVSVPASCDLEEAKSVLNRIGEEAAQEMSAHIKSAFECDGLTRISGSTVTVKFSGVVAPHYHEDVVMELNQRILDEFEKNNLPLA